jgi:hypothetical protein
MPTNMMMFGNPSEFAIEAMIEPDLVPPTTPWGRMRIWCQNVSMGNIEDEHCGLDHAFDSLNEIAKNIDSYWLDEFASMEPIEIIDLLDGALFGWHGDVELEDDRSLDEIRIDVSRYGRFSFLTNWGEQFDGIDKPFILCPPTGAVHIISRYFSSESNFTLLTTRHEFCSVVFESMSWFNQQRQALSGARHA